MPDLILYSLVAFLTGITLNLMPCVLPVMPFKIQQILTNTSDYGTFPTCYLNDRKPPPE